MKNNFTQALKELTGFDTEPNMAEATVCEEVVSMEEVVNSSSDEKTHITSTMVIKGDIKSKENIVSNVLSGSMNQEDAIVLMHDSFGHSTTVAAFPEIIEGLKNQGYSFAPLDNSVVPWCFGY